MRCLCCGKDLRDDQSGLEWHAACIRRFFGTKILPDVELSNEALSLLANRSVEKGYTVTGVQKKLSLHLTDEETPRLTLIDYPCGYILKPQVAEYPHMPESEQLVMCMADIASINTVPHALIHSGDSIAYITKRIDRIIIGNASPKKPAMEDFCQLDLKPTEEKYHGSYERCAKIILKYSDRSGFDLTELFMRLVFCFLTGNSDMHLKNFSLIETEEGSGSYRLSPAYDLLPVQLFLASDTEDTALTLNGKKQHLRRNDFLAFAESAGISRKAANAMIDRMLSYQKKWECLCAESLLPQEMQEKLIALINERVQRLSI